MTQEEKELLLKDLSARLLYGVKVMKQFNSQVRTLKSIDVENYRVYFVENDVNSPFGFDIENPLKFHQQIKPYLRPLSSMTKEEKEEYEMLQTYPGFKTNHTDLTDMYDWLNKKKFDYRGLIEKELALEAPKGMYKIG